MTGSRARKAITAISSWWMQHSPTRRRVEKRFPLLPYVVALIAVLIAWGGTDLLLRIEVIFTSRFLFFVAATLVASWYGGFRPGIFATIVSVIVIDLFLLPPFFVIDMRRDETLLLLVYAILSIVISWIVSQRTLLYQSERKAREALQTQVRLQSLIVKLGQDALTNPDLLKLMNQAVTLLAETLHVEYVKILELREEQNELLLKAGVGWKPGLVGHSTVSAGMDSQAGYTLSTKEPVIVEDLRTETRFSGPPLLKEHGVVSGMSVVIQGREKPYGVFGVHTTNRRTFTQDDIYFLQAVANIVGAAIERDRLLQQAQQLAVHEERQRLARDLHDSVSQSLFSASIIAETLPRLWKVNPEKALATLDDLHRITRSARAEFRVLLMELRPEMIENNSLSDLLQQLTEAVRTRRDIEIGCIIEGDYQPPSSVRTAIYRITQEAMNNTIKHAQAKSAAISLHCTQEQIELMIEDDGRGFDAQTPGKGLGLISMRERAEAIGAEFEIHSRIGQGTRICLKWRPAEDEGW